MVLLESRVGNVIFCLLLRVGFFFHCLPIPDRLYVKSELFAFQLSHHKPAQSHDNDDDDVDVDADADDGRGQCIKRVCDCLLAHKRSVCWAEFLFADFACSASIVFTFVTTLPHIMTSCCHSVGGGRSHHGRNAEWGLGVRGKRVARLSVRSLI